MLNEKSLEKYYKVRKKILNFLGNKCAYCGAEENLEIDHIDCTQKKFNIAKKYYLEESLLFEEIKKCQLLCADCHHKKSIDERGYNSRDQHGTDSCYGHGKCRCELCRKAHSEAMKECRRKRKLRTGKDR